MFESLKDKMKKYRAITLECDCGDMTENLQLQYWNDDLDWTKHGAGTVYVRSGNSVQNVWRRFRFAAQLIVWGQIYSGVDMLLDIDEVVKLHHFVNNVMAEMRVKEDKFLRKEGTDAVGETGKEEQL